MCMRTRLAVCVRVLVVLGVLAGVGANPAAAQGTHTIYGTLNSIGCQYYPTLVPDWTCWGNVTEQNGETFTVELEEQSIGQAGQMQSVLPRKVYILYRIVPAGIDYLRSIVRTQVRAYYIIDAGAVN